jgi:dTDP-4-amino-4,6-dideoxygalactose transaminase
MNTNISSGPKLSFEPNTKIPLPYRLAPAGGFSSPAAIFNVLREMKQQGSGEQQRRFAGLRLCAELTRPDFSGTPRSVLLHGSGKGALLQAFSFLREESSVQLVGISAYTCPDVAACALRAGLRVRPLEIDLLTLDLRREPNDELPLVVLSNLYGLPDNIAPWQESLDGNKPLIIDDACQAALSMTEGGRVGWRGESFGVLSFGRGKAICGLGGGALLIPENRSYHNAGLEVKGAQFPFWGIDGVLRGIGSWLFERPSLYWLPSICPWLALGETRCILNFLTPDIDLLEVCCGIAQIREAAFRSRIFVDNAQKWWRRLNAVNIIQPFSERGYAFDGSVVPLRYPIIFPSEAQRNECYILLTRKGLGASVSYPKVIQEYPELKDYMERVDTPNAVSVSRRILTLPVHRWVKEGDIERAANIIQTVCGDKGLA